MSSNAPLLVMKFGGTSVGDPERILELGRTAAEHSRGAGLVLVVSAMAGVTSSLVSAAQAAARREQSAWSAIGAQLERRHRQAIEALLPQAERDQAEAVLRQNLALFHEFCAGFSLVREWTPRAMDALASLGEVLSAHLVAASLRSRDLKAQAVDASDLIVTDDRFGNASPLLEPTRARLQSRLVPLVEEGVIPVVTGFRGATRDGITTTLGRGASDYTATIIGSALGASEIWIFTDVDGLMTADPRLVPEARVIPEISYREALELSHFGARVIHPRCLELPQTASIPVLIKNSFDRDQPGTRISATPGKPGVRAITSTADAELFTLTGSSGLSFAGLAAGLFHLLDQAETPTLIVTQSSAENVLCFAVRGSDGQRIRRQLAEGRSFLPYRDRLLSTDVMAQVGVVVVVGEAMKGTPGISGRLFGALGHRGINVIAIAQGSSELSISCAVRAADVPAAVHAVHQEFDL